MTKPTITTISNQEELNRYQTELAAATLLRGHLLENEHLEDGNQHKQFAIVYKEELLAEMITLEKYIQQYEKTTATKKQPREVKENQIGNFINPILGLGWSFILGVGIILQETVKVTTAILAAFLFPLNFALEGIRSIWSLYLTARDSDLAQRKTLLGTNIVHLMGLIAAVTIVALAITNPFALPVIFIGITGSGLYKNAYILHQARKLIAVTELDLCVTEIKINELKAINSRDQKIELMLSRLEAKKVRLKEQVANLQTKRFELRRELAFHSLGMMAVGLLLASAVLTLVFPPAAAVVGVAGMLLFASTIIASILTSPPVTEKIKQLGKWIKGLFSTTEQLNLARGNAVAPIVQPALKANDLGEREEDPLLMAPANEEIASDPAVLRPIDNVVDDSEIQTVFSDILIPSKAEDLEHASAQPTVIRNAGVTPVSSFSVFQTAEKQNRDLQFGSPETYACAGQNKEAR